MTEEKKHRRKPAKSELLAEAHVLEQMGANWTLRHAAAFCNWSVSYMVRSSCPKHHRVMEGSVAGRKSVYLIPAEVRRWSESQKVPDEAAFESAPLMRVPDHSSIRRARAYPESTVLTLAEVAEWLGVSPRTVERWPIKRIPLGERTRRYLAKHVLEYVESKAAL